MFNRIKGRLRRDIGIDLGTANTLVYVQGQGIVVDEPTVVALEKKTKRILAVGAAAQRMMGRTPDNIIVIQPLQDGVIADFEVTERMLRHVIGLARESTGLFPPRAVIGVPSSITGVERRAVVDAGINAGASRVFLIEEPMAAALGAGIDVDDPSGSMIVDIGGGTSEIAVFSMGGIVTSRSLPVAGAKINEAIIHYIKRHFNLIIGAQTAEQLKRSTGTVDPAGRDLQTEVKGRDLVSGLPKTITVTSRQIQEAVADPIASIINEVRMTLERTPPELIIDIQGKGIVLTGGGALLHGIDRLLVEALRINVYIASDPLTCVARGAGAALELNWRDFKRRLFSKRQQV
jgi:rod shape-determining protein MreB